MYFRLFAMSTDLRKEKSSVLSQAGPDDRRNHAARAAALVTSQRD